LYELYLLTDCYYYYYFVQFKQKIFAFSFRKDVALTKTNTVNVEKAFDRRTQWMAMKERILVIRLGALGDLVLCFAAFQTIRKAHPGAEIALLTMPAFQGFARQMPWFDTVLTDLRSPRYRIDIWWQLWRSIRRFRPTRVYDLQGKSRQDVLYFLLGGPLGPEWSGAAPFCSHPRLWPPQPGMHFVDFLAAQLERARINVGGGVDLSWLDGAVEGLGLPERYALIIPGCAPERLYKRWPAEKYAELAMRLKEKGLGCVAIGTVSDGYAISEIAARAPHVIDLCGKTSLGQVAALARRAACVVGNDTGPTHLAAAVGGRTVALMSDKVDPVWSAPRGPHAVWLQGKPLGELGVAEVLDELQERPPTCKN
jgi:ADP-heptose:LPS heptosyltransferase